MAEALNYPCLRLKYGQQRYPNSLCERTGAFSRLFLFGSNRKVTIITVIIATSLRNEEKSTDNKPACYYYYYS